MGYTEGLCEDGYGRMPGICYGAENVEFRVISETQVCELVLFGASEKQEKRIPMCRMGSSSVFCVRLSKKEVESYETYLFETENGRFVDSYARAVCGRENFGVIGREIRSRLPERRKKGKAGFVCPAFSSLLFYKLHVRGFTKHTSSGVKQKGTFAGLMEKIPYLKELGITAVLLMPVYEFDECMKVSKTKGALSREQLQWYEERYGSEFVKAQQAYERQYEEITTVEKVNYWGYTGSNFYFAPKASYAADAAHAGEELQACVEALHAAGIAVFYEFFFENGVSWMMILDCLRYWTHTYGADGFHLIGNGLPMRLLLEDAYLSGVKFMVTDMTGLQTEGGCFEKGRVALYNDGFRNVMRRFVKGDENTVGEFLQQFCMAAPETGKIQYIADQNGFSLYDLYAYDRKHNEENREENKDGEDYNYSWNCGVEGETTKKKIAALRARLRKNALCMAFLAQSVPLLFAGDEFGHTKKGNNNAYCQDNEISWLNWRWNKERKEQVEFVKKLIDLRKRYVLLNGGKVLRESDYRGLGLPEFSYHGVMLWQPDFAPYSRTISLLLCGGYATEGPKDDIYLLFNMHWEELSFALPGGQSAYEHGSRWKVALDTSEKCEIVGREDKKAYAVTADTAGQEWVCKVPPRTVVVVTRCGETVAPRKQKTDRA